MKNKSHIKEELIMKGIILRGLIEVVIYGITLPLRLLLLLYIIIHTTIYHCYERMKKGSNVLSLNQTLSMLLIIWIETLKNEFVFIKYGDCDELRDLDEIVEDAAEIISERYGDR